MVLVSSAFLRLVSRFVCRTNWAKLTLRGSSKIPVKNSVQNSAVPAALRENSRQSETSHTGKGNAQEVGQGVSRP